MIRQRIFEFIGLAAIVFLSFSIPMVVQMLAWSVTYGAQ